jgi:hypothetical protein
MSFVVLLCVSFARAESDGRGWAEEHHLSRNPGIVWIENTGNGVAVLGSSDDGVGLQAMSEGNGFALVATGTSFFNGDVGIGTTQPWQKLEVAGNIRAHAGDLTNVEIWANCSDTFDYAGIALTNGYHYPATRLQVYGTKYLTPEEFHIRHYPNAPIVFSTNNAERLRITGAGDVGLGTTAPSEKLEVEGNVKAWEFITGDITFQRDDEKLWRMYEDEGGLYIENLKTGKTSKVFVEDDLKLLIQKVEQLEREISRLKEER